MNRFLKWVLGVGFLVVMAAILIVLFLRGRQEAAADAEQGPGEGTDRRR